MSPRHHLLALLAEARGAEIHKDAFETEDRARNYRVRLLPGGRHGPARLQLTQLGRGWPELKLRPESRLDRLGKRLRINRELQTGDREFDAAVYLESDVADAELRELLGLPALRAAARDLVAAGWSLSLGSGGLTAETAADAEPDTMRARFEAALERLDALAAAGERFSAGPYRTLPGRRRAEAVIVASALLLAAGFAGVIYGTWDLRLFDDRPQLVAALAGVPLGVLGLAGVAALLRGRSTSLRALAISAALLLPAMPMACAVGLQLANGWLDTTPPREHLTTVVGERVARGKNYTYYLRLASWREGSGAWELKVRRDEHARLGKPGTPVKVRRRDGALGLPWLEALEPADR